MKFIKVNENEWITTEGITRIVLQRTDLAKYYYMFYYQHSIITAAVSKYFDTIVDAETWLMDTLNKD